MSVHREWEFTGRNKDGSHLRSIQIECLTDMDDYDFDCFTWNENDTLFCYGNTDSSGAYERVKAVLERFVSIYHDVELFVTVQQECETVPYIIIAKDGKVREITGKITYYFDDTGEEVDIDDYQIS